MKTKKNIYRATAWIYDIEYNKNPPLPDLPFYMDYAEQQCGADGTKGEILELGCGTGRIALPLAKAGFRVTGLDLSEQMLDIFREKIKNETDAAERINIIHGSMADFKLPRKFSLITAPFRAFQALTEQSDIEGTLSCARDHLSEDGIFIVNVFRPYADPLNESWCRDEEYIGEITDEKNGVSIKKYVCRERIDIVNQIIYPYLAYVAEFPDGRTERYVEPLQMKYYYPQQLRDEITRANLCITDEFSWYDKSPTGGKEIIFVCRKA